jgi:hypothetical protein
VILATVTGLLAYRPFLSPLPVWDAWPFLLLPLSAAVAVVYKSIKCESMRDVPRQALSISMWIIGGMAAAAAALAVLVQFVPSLAQF